MSVELKITYDGTTPGLAEHRLSLGAFAEPLKLLLVALQRTASAILASASDDPEYGSKGGSLAADARLLDLELAAIEDGCAQPVFVCTTHSLQAAQSDLAEASVERLLRDIDAERSGKLRNATVRRYLHALPKSVTRQRYAALRDGTLLHEVAFDAPGLAEVPAPLVRLIKVSGNVTSVGFEPGTPFVALRVGARTLRCSASAEQVDTAIALRSEPVMAAVLDGEKPSLVWIRRESEASQIPSLDETISHLHQSWKHTLEVLAR